MAAVAGEQEGSGRPFPADRACKHQQLVSNAPLAIVPDETGMTRIVSQPTVVAVTVRNRQSPPGAVETSNRAHPNPCAAR